MRLLEGKNVVVTGGGGGLGRCYALALAKAGAAVCVSDIDAKTAQATTEAILETGGRAIALQADVTQSAAFEELLDGSRRSSERSTFSSISRAPFRKTRSSIFRNPSGMPSWR